MASYTASLRLVQPATGEYSGTWGTQVNTGLTALVDTSIAGTATITMTAADYTLSTANGASDEARAMVLNLTGTPGAARNVICPAVSKVYIVYNNTTGGFAQTLKTSAGSGISVPNGATAFLRCNGTDVVAATNYLGSLTLGSPLVATSGGTGQSSYAVGDLLFASTTTALSKLADVATGNALISGGVGVAPSYGKIGLTTHVSGTLPVANGGTNATATPTAGAVAYGTGTAYAFNTVGSLGQPLLSGGAGVPTFGTLGVAAGGTGATTLTANNVILGNGTSAVQFVAPGTNGNVLTSNGTTWVSSAAGASLTGTTQSTSPFKTALGSGAGTSATGVGSTFVGYQAGSANTTGGSNTALGYWALSSVTTNANNVAVGSFAASSYTGNNAVAVGNNAAYNYTGTNSFVAIGASAFSAATSGGCVESVAVGYNAGAAITSGQWNVFVGHSAASARTSGSSNISLGYSTNGGSGASGDRNIAVGSFSLNSVTTANNNIAVGHTACYLTTTGGNNTAVGDQALYSNTTGVNNTAVGKDAGDALTTGTQNTFLGSGAGSSGTNDLTTGSNNTIIGYNAAASSTSVSNEITLGNSSVTSFRIPGLSVTWGANTVPYRNIPPVGTKTASYTLAVADVGKYVQVGTSGSIVIPDATFAEGDVVSVFNNTSGSITITCSITTAYISGVDSDKASVSLATRGVATILFISGTVCVISGAVS